MLARNRGAVINVASLAAFIPLPGDAIYSATKAYLVSFSQALQVELKGTGIRVQALCPGLTRTEFHNRLAPPAGTLGDGGFDTARIPSIFWSSPDEVATASLRALQHGRVICAPGFGNQVIAALGRAGVVPFLIRHLPVQRIVGRLLGNPTGDKRP